MVSTFWPELGDDGDRLSRPLQRRCCLLVGSFAEVHAVHL